MRPYSLNDEEIAHIINLRACTTGQHQMIYGLAESFAAKGPTHQAEHQRNVVPILLSRAKNSH